MRIKSDISALNPSWNHGIVQEQLGESLEKLSSGCRISRAGGDVAGLVISEEIRYQINGLDQTMKNVSDGIDMTRTGEEVLMEVHSMLHHMETLTIWAANGVYSLAARANIKEERPQLLDEIDRISANTDLNQTPPFGMEVPAEPFKPPKEEDDITLQIRYTQKEEMSVACYHISSKALKLDKTDFKGVGKANASVEYINKAIWVMTAVRSSFGVMEGHLERTHNSPGVTRGNMAAYESGIRDMNTADEATKSTSLNTVGQAVQSIQACSNSLPETTLRLLQA